MFLFIKKKILKIYITLINKSKPNEKNSSNFINKNKIKNENKLNFNLIQIQIFFVLKTIHNPYKKLLHSSINFE